MIVSYPEKHKGKWRIELDCVSIDQAMAVLHAILSKPPPYMTREMGSWVPHKLPDKTVVAIWTPPDPDEIAQLADKVKKQIFDFCSQAKSKAASQEKAKKRRGRKAPVV